MNKPNLILSRNQVIDDTYTVQFFLKKGNYAESYRVLNADKEVKFLKLFELAKLHRTQFTNEGDILEIELLKNLDHPNLTKYNDSGYLILNNQKFAYAVLDFISGETLADKMAREENLNPYEVKNIILSVLNGLNYLHNQGIIHNEITNLNVMLDLSRKVPIPKIIDFGYARHLIQTHKDFLREGLSPFYQAEEAFNGMFSTQSDIFSIGVLYYHLLEGLPPYFIQIPHYKSNRSDKDDLILKEREKPLLFHSITDSQTQNIILKAINPSPENRFKNVKEFISALNCELQVQVSQPSKKEKIIKPKAIKEGEGFAAIAGMETLKETIRLDVINALQDKERYAEYGLTIPNGMLLYGPPGCGKTFFAEKLAEEIGFNFYQINPSDIQSKWVNASQENIKNLFDEARENAPSVIFIDELDALVPSRDTANVSHMNTSAVNEFLAQMNNSGEDGIFVIGATNRPTAIDSAILRAGRLDKKIYVPVPDFSAREALFRLYLKNRPTEIGINYAELAKSTENYASVDVKSICDEAARQALRANQRITFSILLKTIENTLPSSTLEELNHYLHIKAKMEGSSDSFRNRNSIGYQR